MRDHRNLRAFELANALVLQTYQCTRSFPREEMFGLTSQMRRAGVSTVANIVEGSARNSQADYVRFLDMALGSLRELGYYFDLAEKLGYLSVETAAQLRAQYNECARVLCGLIQSLRSS